MKKQKTARDDICGVTILNVLYKLLSSIIHVKTIHTWFAFIHFLRCFLFFCNSSIHFPINNFVERSILLSLFFENDQSTLRTKHFCLIQGPQDNTLTWRY